MHENSKFDIQMITRREKGKNFGRENSKFHISKTFFIIYCSTLAFKDASKSAGISAISVHFKTIRFWIFLGLG